MYPGWSPYTYALANPLRYNDPTGLGGDDPKDEEEPQIEYHEVEIHVDNIYPWAADAIPPSFNVISSTATTMDSESLGEEATAFLDWMEEYPGYGSLTCVAAAAIASRMGFLQVSAWLMDVGTGLAYTSLMAEFGQAVVDGSTGRYADAAISTSVAVVSRGALAKFGPKFRHFRTPILGTNITLGNNFVLVGNAQSFLVGGSRITVYIIPLGSTMVDKAITIIYVHDK
jgi:hypothetical protein